MSITRISGRSALSFLASSGPDDRLVQFTRSLEDTFQQDEIGDVEVPNGDTVSSYFLNYFNEFLHWLFPLTITCKYAAVSSCRRRRVRSPVMEDAALVVRVMQLRAIRTVAFAGQKKNLSRPQHA